MTKKDVVENAMATVQVDPEPAVEMAEQIVEVTRNNPYLLVGVVIVSLGVGGAVGYQIAKKKLTLEFEKQIDERVEYEADRIRAFYDRMVSENTGDNTPVDDVVANAADAMNDYAAESWRHNSQSIISPARATVQTEEIQIVETVVADPDNGIWNYDHEIAYRETLPHGTPYVISNDEFMQNEPENEQATLTWYASDEALADEKDELIPDTNRVVGDVSLFRFGHGSNDENIVYVRNPRLRMDFEVVRSHGSYKAEVLGELHHTADRRILRKFRGTDE